MKKNDFRLIGYIGTVLGILFLLGGYFAQTYYETLSSVIIPSFRITTYPYQKYAPSLLVSGAVLLVVGLAFLWRAGQEEVSTT